MTTGYLSKGECFATVVEATDFQYGNYQPQSLQVTSNGFFYITYAKQSTGIWNLLHQSYGSSGALTASYNIALPTPIFASCDSADWKLDVSQGSQIAVSIAICWAIGYVFRVLANFLKQNESDIKND